MVVVKGLLAMVKLLSVTSEELVAVASWQFAVVGSRFTKFRWRPGARRLSYSYEAGKFVKHYTKIEHGYGNCSLGQIDLGGRIPPNRAASQCRYKNPSSTW